LKGAGKKSRRECCKLYGREASSIEREKEEDYTPHGKKDDFRKVIPKTSLKHLMSLLTDLIKEETLLQYHGRLLEVKVVQTLKCPLEISGRRSNVTGVGEGLIFRSGSIYKESKKEVL
jgi:hypothetical protein